MILNAPWLGARTQHINVTYATDDAGNFNGVLHTYLSTPQHESVPTQSQFDYAAWRAANLPVPERYAPAHELATYIIAKARGFGRVFGKIWGIT